MCDKKCFSHGLLAGLIAGIAYSFFLLLSGIHREMNTIIIPLAPLGNFMLNFIFCLLAGWLFAYALGKHIHAWLASLLWGLGFGVFLWLLFPMTLFPILAHNHTALFALWNFTGIQANFHALIGLLIYSGLLGVLYYFLKTGHLHKLKVPKH